MGKVKGTFTDLHTQRRERFNEIVVYEGMYVPARQGKHSATHWHPDRVPTDLLRTLNAGTDYEPAMLRELERREASTMSMRSVPYVRYSEVLARAEFHGIALNAINDALDGPYTWGGNNLTLASVQAFLDLLERDVPHSGRLREDLVAFLDLQGFGAADAGKVFIDLEN